jgi:hypothetical protein
MIQVILKMLLPTSFGCPFAYWTMAQTHMMNTCRTRKYIHGFHAITTAALLTVDGVGVSVAEAKIKNGDVEDRKRSYLGGTAN